MEDLLLALKPVTVLLRDIMPEQSISTMQQKKIETIRRVVQTYNCAHVSVSQYFKRITCDTNNNDEIFTICETFYKTVNCWSFYFFIFIFASNRIVDLSCEKKKKLNFVYPDLQLVNDHRYTDMLAETMCNVLSSDLCRLETIKFDTKLSVDVATEKIISHEIKLSHRYELLANILHRSQMLSRECLLTVFSLNPSWKNYITLVEFHKRYSSSERYCSLNGLNSILGAQTIEENGYVPEVNPVQSILQGDKLATQLDKSGLWNDLVAIIINPRIKTLRWTANNWSELREMCQKLCTEPNHKVSLIKQNVAAMDRKLLRYARENVRVLAKRLFCRTLKRLSNRKLKQERRRHVCCLDEDGEVLGFVQMP